MDKSELVAFEREKRLYKDAYVENFRSVRYFPSLAAIGTGRADGGSIVLVQEPQLAEPQSLLPPRSNRFEDVASRLVPPDSLEQIFDATMPLTSFRSAVMCKHTKARQQQRANEKPTAANNQATASADRYRQQQQQQPAVFKPTSVVEAKSAIQHRLKYDAQPFRDNSPSSRSVSPRADAPRWAHNNAASARREICSKIYFNNVPLEGPVKADRKYTQEFIQMHMEAFHAGRRRAGEGKQSNK